MLLLWPYSVENIKHFDRKRLSCCIWKNPQDNISTICMIIQQMLHVLHFFFYTLELNKQFLLYYSDFIAAWHCRQKSEYNMLQAYSILAHIFKPFSQTKKDSIWLSQALSSSCQLPLPAAEAVYYLIWKRKTHFELENSQFIPCISYFLSYLAF